MFPLLLPDAKIGDPRFRISIIKHWEEQIAELDGLMKEVEASNFDGIRQDIDDYRQYRARAGDILRILADMRAAQTMAGDGTDFVELLDALDAAAPR